MRTTLRLLIHAVEAAIVLAVVYYEPSYNVRGIVHREAYFDGKPTSYWRDELERWDVRKANSESGFAFRRSESWFERNCPLWIRQRPPTLGHNELFVNAAFGPSILRRNPEARPVLEVLLDDPSPGVRRLARLGLGMETEVSEGDSNWSDGLYLFPGKQ